MSSVLSSVLSNPAIPAPAMLDGVRLPEAESWGITPDEQAVVRQAASGRRRKAYAAPLDAALPPVRVLYRFRLGWSHVPDRESVERVLAVPEVHTLVLWRHQTIAWRGDGARRDFTLPNAWTSAPASITPPGGLSADRFAPSFRVGAAGAPLAAAHVDEATFAGDPAAGEAWVWESRIKLGEAPAAGAWLFGSVVPVYQVISEPAGAEKRLILPTLEPAELVLLEVG